MIESVSLVDLVLHDRLQRHVDGETDIGSVFGKLLLPTVHHDFTPLTIVLDHAEAVVPGQFGIEHFFDAVDPVTGVINEPQNMAEHFAVRVAAQCAFLKIEPVEICLIDGPHHVLGLLLTDLLADHHVGSLGGKLFGEFVHRHVKEGRRHRCQRCGILNTGSICRDRAHRDIDRQFLSVSVKNAPSTGGNGQTD